MRTLECTMNAWDNWTLDGATVAEQVEISCYLKSVAMLHHPSESYGRYIKTSICKYTFYYEFMFPAAAGEPKYFHANFASV